MTFRRLVGGVAIIGMVLLSAGACRQQADAPPAGPRYTTTATVRELMQSIVDPSADVVWNAVGTVVADKGVEEISPRTDAEWADVRYGALRLAEATNLLMMPGRASAPPGAQSAAPGVELMGPEIDALINADREAWNARASALLDATLKALHAIDAKDPQQLFNVGEQIEMACEGCHSHYWYPNQPLPGAPGGSKSDEN